MRAAIYIQLIIWFLSSILLRLQAQKCPTSWKKGLPDMPETSDKFSQDFLFCMEGSKLTLYVPHYKDGNVIGNSGVTLGVGVDLGSKNDDFFYKYGFDKSNTRDEEILKILRPFYGKKKQDAMTALSDYNPTPSLTVSQANKVTNAAQQYFYETLTKWYNNKRKSASTVKFGDLHYGIRTALISYIYQHGKIKEELGSAILENDWKNTVKYLRSQESYKRRRRNEAELIEAAIAKGKDMEILFVVDESGSIGESAFQFAKSFLLKFIDNIDIQTTKIGIIFYSTNVKIAVSLGEKTDKQNIIQKVKNWVYAGEGTQTGLALQTSASQFNFSSNIDDKKPPPKIVIVMTDGYSGDNVTEPSKALHEKGVIVFSVGIGRNFNMFELNTIASLPENVLSTASYEVLSSLITQIVSSVAYAPNPTPIAATMKDEINAFDSSFYQFTVPRAQAFTFSLTPDTPIKLNIFASRSDPNPDSIVNDVSHDGSGDNIKQITVAPPSTSNGRILQEDSELVIEPEERLFDPPEINEANSSYSGNSTHYFVFITVQAESSVAFSFESELCDPNVCKQGSNQFVELPPSPSEPIWMYIVFPILGAFFLLLFGILIYFIIKKRKQRKYQESSSQKATKVSIV